MFGLPAPAEVVADGEALGDPDPDGEPVTAEEMAFAQELVDGFESDAKQLLAAADAHLADKPIAPADLDTGWYWIGNRMSGGDICEITEPSTYSTIECTIDCG